MTLSLGLAAASALVTAIALASSIARGSNGGINGFVAMVVAVLGGLLTVGLAVSEIIFWGGSTPTFAALGLAVGTPLLAALMIYFFVPKSAFRL